VRERLSRLAENVAALMLAVMFSAFLIQIVFRYVLNFPVGWTSELTVALWLWLVLFGAAFVLKESEEIRFDLVVGAVGRRPRVVMGILASVALIVLYVVSLPASWSYVTFMKVERSSYLKIPMNWMFSIYIAFLVAVIVRYAWLLWHFFRGEEVDVADPTKASSGL
jgi:TRAP-type C4-dicarboxylate transport system permease small subunit